MGVEALSRIQFATVAIFHFLFVPLTLGLSVLVAFMETRYARTGDETWLRMTRYWSRLLLINFAVGVVTGLTLEFQFGMNWAEYSKFVGDIFGAPLAIEATVAFFLESTFIGLWVFSWKRVSRGTHAAIMWVVASASTFSALWILLANGWMQKPRGYVLAGGKAQLVDFGALIWNPYAWIKFFHVITAAYTLSAFFIMGISAVNLLRGRNPQLFKKSFRLAATFAVASSVLIVVAGDLSGVQVAKFQPTKLAAIESQWKTETGAPFYLLQFPDPGAQRNIVEALPIAKGLSFLAYHDVNATVKGLEEFPRRAAPGDGELRRIPPDGGPGFPLRAAGGGLRRSLVDGQARIETLVSLDHDGGPDPALPGQRAGVDRRGDRPAAVDRVWAAQDGGRGIALHHAGRRPGLAHLLPRHLQRPCRRGRFPARQVRPQD